MTRFAFEKSAKDHDRMAAFFARLGKSRAAARHIRRAEDLRTAQQIRREIKQEKVS